MTSGQTDMAVDTATDAARPRAPALSVLLRSNAVRVPVLAWIASRLLVIVVAVIAQATVGYRGPDSDPAVSGPLSLLGSWDTFWYLGIARDGYTTELSELGVAYSNVAFFPLIPGIGWLADALGLNPFLTLVVVSHLGFLVALVAFHRLASDRLPVRSADLATWCFALFPATVAASMAYTEGVTLALTLAAAWCATRRRWWWAAGLAGVAGLARPTGALAALLVGLIALRTAPGRLSRRRAIAVALPGFAALTGFLAFMLLRRGSATAPIRAQEAWGRGFPGLGIFTNAWENTRELWDEVTMWEPRGAWFSLIRDLIFLSLYLVLLVRLARASPERWRSPWVIYCALALAIPLSTGTFNSFSRLGVVAAPLFWMVPSLMAPEGRIPPRVWITVTTLMLAGATFHLVVSSP